MAEKVKLSKDGTAIDFVQSESIPTSVKKFRQSPEIEGFYRFIFENDLQKETYEILERIVNARKAKKKADKLDAAPPKKVAPVIVKKPEVQLKKAEAAPKKAEAAPKKVEAPKKVAAPVKAVKVAAPGKKPLPVKAPTKDVKAVAKAATPKKAAPPAKKKHAKKK